MNKTALVLVSHGGMAEETLKSAKMIVGNISSAYAVSMDATDGSEGLGKKLKGVMNEINSNRNINKQN